MLKRSFFALTCAFFLNACGDGNNQNSENGSETFAQNGNESQSVPRLRACYKGDAWECQVENEVVRLVNDMRRQKLDQNFETSFVARQWSDYQARVAEISHDGFPQARQRTLREEFPSYEIYFRAENVAMTYAPNAEPKKVAQILVKNWYDSIGHRENMLGKYSAIGVGISKRGDYVYGTQIFF